jgi:hypothetical protein
VLTGGIAPFHPPDGLKDSRAALKGQSINPCEGVNFPGDVVEFAHAFPFSFAA